LYGCDAVGGLRHHHDTYSSTWRAPDAQAFSLSGKTIGVVFVTPTRACAALRSRLVGQGGSWRNRQVDGENRFFGSLTAEADANARPCGLLSLRKRLAPPACSNAHVTVGADRNAYTHSHTDSPGAAPVYRKHRDQHGEHPRNSNDSAHDVIPLS